eukprot:919863-Alexandrium_andersonii.AAC.1
MCIRDRGNDPRPGAHVRLRAEDVLRPRAVGAALRLLAVARERAPDELREDVRDVQGLGHRK